MASLKDTFKQKVLKKFKETQGQVEQLVSRSGLVSEVKKIANKQGKEILKMIDADVNKVTAFVEKELKSLDQLKKKIPSELNRVKKIVDSQKQELANLLKQKRSARPTAGGAKKAKKKTGAAKTAKKSTAKRATVAKP